MKNLRNFSIHTFHNIPDLEDVYPAFIVSEYVSNYPYNHFITAPSMEDAISEVFSKINEEYKVYLDIPELSAEMVMVDEDDIVWFKKLNHEH